ncbi:aminoglycoside phosphotransferase family protein [Shewanella maritima]|uniref:aminoglycoside phosphotransferase family protein n=1 Tax=Shewanella maritima TaxID=2520507 RepID=UPI0037352F8C
MEFIRQQVLPCYGVPQSAAISVLGEGHINQTYLVKSPQKSFVLQKINTDVFPKPCELVRNATKIAQHLQLKADKGLYQLQVISPVLTEQKQAFVDLGDGGFWRAITYLPNSHTISVVNNLEDAGNAASAFGHFSASLSDVDPDSLTDVIDDFLNLSKRIEQLKLAVANDNAHRLAQCRQWVDFTLSQQVFVEHVNQLLPQLPRRVCHNDTKINNMLFDKRDMSSMAVIDLDTCMSGYLMFDFGDMVRAFCSPEPEDSTELSKVIARPEVIAHASQCYLSQFEGIITPTEKNSLWIGLKAMALMLGSRFLTDYLNGDQYFAIQRPNHNLDRAANQLTIYQSLLDQEAKLAPLFE